jgi:MFS family permease
MCSSSNHQPPDRVSMTTLQRESAHSVSTLPHSDLSDSGRRGEGPLGAGALLVPQGIGAAIAMPIAGLLTDRIGARRVVILA